MKTKIINILITISCILVIAGISLYGGYHIFKLLHHCPVIISDTTYVYDTTPHYIHDTIPFYYNNLDTIIYSDTIFKDVDTLSILKDYFATHIYDRSWSDTNILVNLTDYISQNKSIKNEFKYKLLKPTIIVENKIENIYYNYLTLGVNMQITNIKYSTYELNYNYKKGYIGLSYMPELNIFGVKGGITILKIK
jgi:hypothetical protein